MFVWAGVCQETDLPNFIKTRGGFAFGKFWLCHIAFHIIDDSLLDVVYDVYCTSNWKFSNFCSLCLGYRCRSTLFVPVAKKLDPGPGRLKPCAASCGGKKCGAMQHLWTQHDIHHWKLQCFELKVLVCDPRVLYPERHESWVIYIPRKNANWNSNGQHMFKTIQAQPEN